MRVCCRFRFLTQVVHVQCPNFFLPSQVTRQASFGKNFFFESPSLKKFSTSKIFEILGVHQPSGGEIWGLGVSERAKIFFRKDPSKVLYIAGITSSYDQLHKNRWVKTRIFCPKRHFKPILHPKQPTFLMSKNFSRKMSQKKFFLPKDAY